MNARSSLLTVDVAATYLFHEQEPDRDYEREGATELEICAQHKTWDTPSLTGNVG